MTSRESESPVVIVDYGMGNTGSVVNILKKSGSKAVLSSDPSTVAEARRLVLPGVGSFDRGIESLRERGLIGPLRDAVLGRGVPILGICLGMQLFTAHSEEGDKPGLGWINAKTARFAATSSASLKVPHMGWNEAEVVKADDPIFSGLSARPRFYFVHSYHLICEDIEDIAAWTAYGYRFVSAIRRGNIWGTQFHPEKSHKYGLAVIANFTRWTSHV